MFILTAIIEICALLFFHAIEMLFFLCLGHVDSSGIRFYVTSQLRQNDAGIMELGLEYTNKMAIPPRQNKFLLKGYCIPECTTVVSF